MRGYCLGRRFRTRGSLGVRDQRLDQAVEHDLRDGQRQEGAGQAVSRPGR